MAYNLLNFGPGSLASLLIVYRFSLRCHLCPRPVATVAVEATDFEKASPKLNAFSPTSQAANPPHFVQYIEIAASHGYECILVKVRTFRAGQLGGARNRKGA